MPDPYPSELSDEEWAMLGPPLASPERRRNSYLIRLGIAVVSIYE